VLGAFVAGPASLARFAGDAPLNTDDRPVVAYSAPRITYAPDSTPRERLFALLDALDVAPVDVFANAADASLAPRMVAYWRARNRYLAVGRDVRAVADVRAMVARVRAPLLGVLRISPDFRPAYDPLLNMASALVDVDPAGGRQLLRDLALASPARAEAAHALGELEGGPAKVPAL
jgi:spermidine synthase